MGIERIRVNERAKTERDTSNLGARGRGASKVVLAARYGVGIRTIENWHYAGIISARFELGRAVFDVVECDRQLLTYKNKTHPQ